MKQVPAGIHVHTPLDNGKSPAELLFRRVLNTKMPELSGLDDEEADMSDQGARDRDTEKKQANKDYVDKKFHAKERNVQEEDLVLLEQKRQNKLSSSYKKEPYEVMTRYGDQVVLRSSNGGEYRRNMQHIKPFNIPDHERAASQSELGSESATAVSASATQVMVPVTPVTAPAEIPRMSLPPAAVETPTCMSKSAQRLYVQYIWELNSVSVWVVSELTCNRAERLYE